MMDLEVKNGADFYQKSTEKRENTIIKVSPSGVLHPVDEEHPKGDDSSLNQPVNAIFLPKT